jgi:hypothetical protein
MFHSLSGPVERNTTFTRAALGRKFIFIFGGRIRSSKAVMGGGRSAPFGVLMSLKRQVRAAHGYAHSAKTH